MLRDFPVPFRRVACALAIAAAIGATPLAGCGIKGPLKPPPAAAAGTPPAAPATVPAPPTSPERKP